ncbi:MAG: UTRA domain-containing protein, partial [Proteobacteria bacterium]|nr:UTRA domain-containing protein [Pseudomonadota bacterium]
VMDYRRKSTHISSRLPTAREARILHQSKTRPVLVTESINVDPRDWPIEFCETRFASERVQFTIET